jgi:hypothetical protein
MYLPEFRCFGPRHIMAISGRMSIAFGSDRV